MEEPQFSSEFSFARDAVDAISKQIDDAYQDLDDKEGMTEVMEKPNGTFIVKQVGK